MVYTLKNIRKGKKHFAGNTYGCLYDDAGHLVISATLDYILESCKQNGYTITVKD